MHVRFLARDFQRYVSLAELPFRRVGYLYAKNFAIFRLRGDRRAMAGK